MKLTPSVIKRILINLLASAAVLLFCLFCLWLDKFWSFALSPTPDAIFWVFLLGGMALFALAETAFFRKGGGTGALADPPHRLVAAGIYRWVRNPIYLGAEMVMLGVALSRRSPSLLLVACLFLPVMHMVVVRWEEPRLEKIYGSAYSDYKCTVPRWIPRPPK
jgi:protein-S-isoprenylcysteine O-methyltransferase Ste14